MCGATCRRRRRRRRRLVSNRAPGIRALLRDPLLLMACGFGSGALRPAPGTWGSLIGFLLFLPLAMLPEMAYGVVVFAGAVLGVPLCGYAGRQLGAADHSAIVWDEIIGVWLALAGLPLEPAPLIAGFVLFRLFDIIKPWPINWLDRRISGGLGVMLDDIAAGLAAQLLVQGLLWLQWL